MPRCGHVVPWASDVDGRESGVEIGEVYAVGTAALYWGKSNLDMPSGKTAPSSPMSIGKAPLVPS